MFLSFNLQYLRYERRGVVKFGVLELIGLNAKLAVSSDLVSGYGENFFSAGVFVIGIDI